MIKDIDCGCFKWSSCCFKLNTVTHAEMVLGLAAQTQTVFRYTTRTSVSARRASPETDMNVWVSSMCACNSIHLTHRLILYISTYLIHILKACISIHLTHILIVYSNIHLTHSFLVQSSIHLIHILIV